MLMIFLPLHFTGLYCCRIYSGICCVCVCVCVAVVLLITHLCHRTNCFTFSTLRVIRREISVSGFKNNKVVNRHKAQLSGLWIGYGGVNSHIPGRHCIILSGDALCNKLGIICRININTFVMRFFVLVHLAKAKASLIRLLHLKLMITINSIVYKNKTAISQSSLWSIFINLIHAHYVSASSFGSDLQHICH